MIKILLVEDDAEVLETLRLSLSEEGYDIEATTSGTDALHFLLEKPFDIVISDMNLGDTSGINVLKAARSINPDVKFILITAYSSIETAIEAIRLGIFDYMIKPFDTAEVKFRVNRAVSKLDTDRQRRQIEKQYRIVMDYVPFGIVIISPEMEITEVNKKIYEWFPDLKVNETPHCFEIFCTPPRSEKCDICAAEKSLRSGKPHTQTQSIDYNGSTHKIRCTANPIIDQSGEITGVLMVMEQVK